MEEDGQIVTINMITKNAENNRYSAVLVNNSDYHLRIAKNEKIATIAALTMYNEHITLKPL